jgi:hexosaminidase
VGCENKETPIKTTISIIPEPHELKVYNGQFKVNEQTRVIVNSEDEKVKAVAQYFVDQLNQASGYSIKVNSSSNKEEVKNSIEFTDKNIDTTVGNEGYILKSDTDRIILRGTPHGLFYGIQTLFQLLPNEIYSNKGIANIEWSIPSVEIKDKPRFKWRGMHLDVGRHLFPVSFIKKYIDYIALHKLNTFHWHLTEDQGWRIEIKKYPLLTEIGAWRKGTQIRKTDKDDGIRYGGFYTQDEIKDIVAYANERFVTVVPEIELPGHSVAALTAYPELSCTGGPFEVRTKWGIADDIYCAGNEATFSYLEDVLTEVLDLFPSKYIHIGGDEAPKKRWEKCSKCQARIKKEGLNDEHELQSYFISRIEKFLNSKGRQIIGWDEILEGGLAPNAAEMSWRGIEGGISAAKQKHYVVMTPSDYMYFDFYEGNPKTEPLAIGGFLPLDKVYGYEPVPEELTADEEKYILGVQANQWTEYIATPELAEYMTLPRLCALSEIAWSPKEKRNLEDFLDRMQVHYARLDQLGINYRGPRLEGFKKKNIFIDQAKVEFITKQKGTEIRYTMDGTDPSKYSTLYTIPFVIIEGVKIKLMEISSNGKHSPVYIAEYIQQQPIEAIVVKEKKKGVKYQYFEFEESIKSVGKLLNMKPISNGITDNLVYPFEDEKLPEQFGLIYKGFIEIPADGVYTFGINSNDGSTLYIADQMVVDNDGSHSAHEEEGEIALKAGMHKIQLSYFQVGGGKVLQVFIKSDQIEKTEIGNKILSH